MKKYKVLFADLDGTLIDTVSGNTFPKGIWDMKLNFEVLDAIKKLTPKYIAIITNQGGIEKGFVNNSHFISKITFISDAIKEYCRCDCHFNYCVSNNKDDWRRKPNVGMLEQFYHDYYGNYDTAYLSKKGYWIANDGKEIIVSFWLPIPKFETKK